MRRLVTGWLIAALPLAGLAGAGPAAAEPPPPCSFTLSAPQVVERDGAAMVTATVAPAECGAPSTPYMSVACLQVVGGDTPLRCAQGAGWAPAQVYLPLIPGATYTATGRGGGRWIGQDPAPRWQQLGPHTATL